MGHDVRGEAILNNGVGMSELRGEALKWYEMRISKVLES
jgi:hypothetical protein